MKKTLLLYFFLATAIQLSAQQKEFIFKNYTQEEGLPSNETYYIFEDSKHYLWIATDLGVVRYDGNKFEQFNLPDNVIFRITEDHKGRIWFFSHKGLLAYFENERLHPYKYNSLISERIGKIQIIDAVTDINNNIYLSSALDSNFIISSTGKIKAEGYIHHSLSNTLLLLQDAGSGKLLSEIQGRYSSIVDSLFIQVKKQNKQTLYKIPLQHIPFTHLGSIYGDSGVIYNFSGKHLIKLNANGSFSVKQLPEEILCVYLINEKLYVGMIRRGLTILDKSLHDLNNEQLVLPNKSITCIKEDYEGGIWISTLESGIFYLKNTNIYKYPIPNEQAQNVSRLLNLKDSILLYSTGDGLFTIDHDKSKLFLKAKNSGANGLVLDNRKVLYYSGGLDNFKIVKRMNDPLISYINMLQVPSQPVIFRNDSIFTGRSNHVAVFKSSFLSSNMRYKKDDAYFHKWKAILPKPAKLMLDASSTLWAACNDGLYKSTPGFDTMLPFMASSKLLKQGVSNLKQMHNGWLVAGIRFSGIALIKDSAIVVNITEEQGLLSNKIRYILPVNDNLWVATGKGISVIQFTSFYPLKYVISNISKKDGFYNFTINHLEEFQHKIVAATSNGLYFIENPDLFLHRKLPAVLFHIKNITYYKGDTTGISSITLPYKKNRLVIKYTAVSFSSYETVTYLYRFDKNDTNWQQTSNTELLLENLEPGSYQLHIKAFIPNQQRYSEEKLFSILIEKPWWQNNWLRLLFILSLASLLYLFVNYRIKRIKAEEKRKTDLNKKLSELEQTALRSQMNPHFIFNCLTSIQQLIISGNKVDANEYLVKFSRLIRKTLEMSTQPFISIKEEKEYLEEYLFLEQLRLSGKFEYSITADESINIDRIFIPNMMVQPIVENCVRHGVKSLEDKSGIIAVTFSVDEKLVSCTITDNGVGRKNTSDFSKKNFTKHKSYGMDIVRKRLETFSESNITGSSIEINDIYDKEGQPAGTEVILHLPYKLHL